MQNKDMSAMPCGASQDRYNPGYTPEQYGLTKREMFAMHFHAALLTATNDQGDWTGVNANAASEAVREADKLLASLEAN